MKVLLDNTYPLASTYEGGAGQITLSGYSLELSDSVENFVSNIASTIASTVSNYGLEVLRIIVYEEQTEFWGWTTPVTRYTVDVHVGNPYGSYGGTSQAGLPIPLLPVAIVGGLAVLLVAALAMFMFSVSTVGIVVYMITRGGKEITDTAKQIADAVAKAIAEGAKMTQYIAIGMIGLGGLFLAYQVLQESKHYRPQIQKRIAG